MNLLYWLLTILGVFGGGLSLGLSGGGSSESQDIITSSSEISYTTTSYNSFDDSYYQIYSAISSTNTDYGDAPYPPYGIASHDIQDYDWLGEEVSEDSSYGGVGWQDTYDDGIILSSNLVPGKEFTLTFIAVAYNPTQTSKSWHQYVKIWIDWDQSGSWEDGESLLLQFPKNYWHRYVKNLAPGEYLQEVVVKRFVVPSDAKLGTTWLRARISRYWGMKPTGNYTHGECEDYPINIVPEPGTFGMLGVGIALLTFLKKRFYRTPVC